MKRPLSYVLLAILAGCATKQAVRPTPQATQVASAPEAAPVLRPGKKMRKSGRTTSVAVEAEAPLAGDQSRRHLVERGDTLWAIAAKAYNGAPEAPGGRGGYLWPLICEQNRLNNCHLIRPGDIIVLIPRERLAETPTETLRRHLKVAYSAP